MINVETSYSPVEKLRLALCFATIILKHCLSPWVGAIEASVWPRDMEVFVVDDEYSSHQW